MPNDANAIALEHLNLRPGEPGGSVGAQQDIA
jgi:hypothetical protein